MSNKMSYNGKRVMKKKRFQHWKKLAAALSCLVVFVTTYALILPAITLTGNSAPICGLEEHQHSDSCYVKQLVCQLEPCAEEDAHVHTEECYELVQTLVCQLEESEEHQHSAECVSEETRLICGLEEQEAHEHDITCYEQSLACEMVCHEHSQLCYAKTVAEAVAVYAYQEYLAQHGEETFRSWYYEEVKREMIPESAGDWSAAFLSYCVDLAGDLAGKFPYGESAEEWLYETPEILELLKTTFEYKPAVGDGVFVYVSLPPVDEEAEPVERYIVGVITDVERNGFTAILPDLVETEDGSVIQTLIERSFDLDEESLVAYLVLPEAQFEQESEQEKPQFDGVSRAYVYENGRDVTDILEQQLGAALWANFSVMPLDLDEPVQDLMLDDSATVGSGSIYGVSAKWKTRTEGENDWKDWSGEVPADAVIKFDVKYNNIDPAVLKAHGYSIKYKPDDIFDSLTASGDIIVGSAVRGAITTDSAGCVVLTFDPDWVDNLIPNSADDNKRTISGDFYFQATFDLEELDKHNGTVIQFGNVNFEIPDYKDATAQFGDLSIDKTLVTQPSGKHYTMDEGRYYLQYQITLRAGHDKMTDIVVRDKLAAGSGSLVEHPYVGVNYDGGETEITTAIEDKNPYENVGASKLYLTNQEGTLRDENGVLRQGNTYSNDANGKYMVWAIDEMAAGESRTLTYYVEVDPDYFGIHHKDNELISNDAELYSLGYPHSHDGTTFSENANAGVSKTIVDDPNNENDGVKTVTIDGKLYYRVPYKIVVTANSSNSYPMTNIKLVDNFQGRTPDEYEMFANYDRNSVSAITYSQNGGQQTTNKTATNLSAPGNVVWDADVKKTATIPTGETTSETKDYTFTPGFSMNVGTLQPGQSATFYYDMLFEAGHEGLSNEVGIKNRVDIYNDPSKMPSNTTGYNPWLAYDTQDVNPAQQTWVQKSKGGQTTLAQTITIPAGDQVFNLGSGIPVANPGSFVVNAGAYQYQVVVNEQGKWDVSGSTLGDRFTNNTDTNSKNILLYSGYVKVEAINPTTNQTKTVWINIDGRTNFNIIGQTYGLNLSSESGEKYVLTYYADVNPAAKVGEIIVSNDFTLSGAVVGPGNSVTYVPGVYDRVGVTVTGDYKFNTRKEFWYYDPDDPDFFYDLPSDERVYTGAMYWVVRVDANRISAGTTFQDSVNTYPDFLAFNGILRKEHSFIGFYVGNIEGKNNEGRSPLKIAELYDNIDELTEAGVLTNVQFRHDMKWTSGGTMEYSLATGLHPTNIAGWSVPAVGAYGETLNSNRGVNHDLTIYLQEDVGLAPHESLYLIVKTEPYLLPDDGGVTTRNYKNKVNIWDGSEYEYPNKWPWNTPQQEATTQLSADNKGLEKNPQGVYQVKNGVLSPLGDLSNLTTSTDTNTVGWRSDVALDRTDFGTTSAPNFTYGDGVYVGWTIGVNTLSQLSGAYTVSDTLPEGLELVYVSPYRAYGNFNTTNGGFYYNGPDINDGAKLDKLTGKITDVSYKGSTWAWTITGQNQKLLDAGWQEHVCAAKCANATGSRNATAAIYYTKDNQFRIYMPKLQALSNHRFDFFVLCKVTDPNIYFEDVTFTNTASLLNARDKLVDADSARITAYNGSLSKADLSTLTGGAMTSATVPYTIVINDTASDMDENLSYIRVPLIDSMSSNLSINIESLRIYAGTADQNNLIYSGETVSGAEAYYATDAGGNRLYWQQDPFAEGSASVTTVGTGAYPVIRNGALAKPGISSGNLPGTNLHQLRTSDSGEMLYSRVKSLDDLTDGIYKIQIARYLNPGDTDKLASINEPGKVLGGSTQFLTNVKNDSFLKANVNYDQASLFTLTKVGEKFTIQDDVGRYLTIGNNYADFVVQPHYVYITPNTNTSNNYNYVSLKAFQINEVNNTYLNHQSGGVRGWSSGSAKNEVGGGIYFYKGLSDLYWIADSDHATVGTTETPYPVMLSGDTAPTMTQIGGTSVVWKTLSGNDAVVGNVQRIQDGVDVTTNIRIAVEPDRDLGGNLTGNTNVKFYNLPDSTMLTITYDVTANLQVGSGNSYSNVAYWEGYEHSEGGNTSREDVEFEAGGTSQAETHGAVKITKYDADDTAKKLTGATFALFHAEYVHATPGKAFMENSAGTFVEMTLEQIETQHIPAVFYDNGTPDDESDDKEIRVERGKDGEAINFYDINNNRIINVAAAKDYRHHLRYEQGTNHVLLHANYGANGRPILYKYDGSGNQLFWTSNEKTQTTITETDWPVLDDCVLALGTTDANGIVTYGLTTDEVNIHFNKIYCIVEVEAPEGYDLDTTEHFFVVPNEGQSGIHLNYFYHTNGVWPANVYPVTRTDEETKTLTYFLNVYDKRASVQVTKDFGGITEESYRPGTYNFGIWDAVYAGAPDGDMVAPEKSLTYTVNDFGYYRFTNGTQTAFTAWRKVDSGWISASGTYDAGANIWIEGTWSAVSIGDHDKPPDATYGILPGHQKVVTFDGLEFGKTYYIFEIGDDGLSIVRSRVDGVFAVADHAVVNGWNYTVTYGPAGNYLMPNGNQAVVNNQITPYKDEHGFAIVPMLQVTNTAYTANVTKRFQDMNRNEIESGLIGTYAFAIYSAVSHDTWYEPDFSKCLDIKTITWTAAEVGIPQKSLTFGNLEKGKVYFIYELDSAGNPIVDSTESVLINNAEFKAEYYNVGYHSSYSGPPVYGDESHTTRLENAFFAGFETKDDQVMVPTVHTTNITSYFELPQTGGIGTKWFTLAGVLLMGIGVTGYLLRRKREGRYR